MALQALDTSIVDEVGNIVLTDIAYRKCYGAKYLLLAVYGTHGVEVVPV